MHSQEPWQSRSPTGDVNKPIVSSTLTKTGRRGPNHSYGRGLPVKRKALVILTVAILAFAMIPAIGAGAAAGQVKIVTPDQLATPSGDTGSTFDRLNSARYVTTAIDDEDTLLAGAASTLQVVIDDDDKDANTLTDYYAIFDSAGTFTNNTFNIRPGTTASNDPNRIASNDNRLLDATNLTAPAAPIADADNARTFPDDTDAGGLIIGNRDRAGGVDASDIVVQAGYYSVAPAETGDENLRESISFTPTTTYTASLFIATTEDAGDKSSPYNSVQLTSRCLLRCLMATHSLLARRGLYA